MIENPHFSEAGEVPEVENQRNYYELRHDDLAFTGGDYQPILECDANVRMNAAGEHDVTWAEIWRPLYGPPSEMKFPYASCNIPMRMFVVY